MTHSVDPAASAGQLGAPALNSFHYSSANPQSPIGPAGMPPTPVGRQAMIPWHRRPIVRVLLSVVAIGVIAVCAAIMVLMLGFSLGPNVVLLAAAFAALPVPILVLALLWLDRYEPEPWYYLAFAFGWGAFVATVVALIVNSVGLLYYQMFEGSKASRTVAIFLAPPTEEIAKAAPLFLLLLLAMLGLRQINGVIDGIVYAGYAAIGFAFTENILYFGQAYVVAVRDGNDGLAALFFTFVVRAVMSPFAHPLFTAMTGIGIGLAVRARHRGLRFAAPIVGLLVAIGLHALWNFLASGGDFRVMLGGYLLLMVPLFFVLVGFAIWLRSREARLTTTMLPVYVTQGWLTQAELDALRGMRQRSAAREWARTYGGSAGAKAMQEFQLGATRLALLRETLVRGTPPADYAEQERDLLTILTSRRQAILAYAQRWARALSHSPWTSHFPPVYPNNHHSYVPSGHLTYNWDGNSRKP